MHKEARVCHFVSGIYLSSRNNQTNAVVSRVNPGQSKLNNELEVRMFPLGKHVTITVITHRLHKEDAQKAIWLSLLSKP